MATTTRLGSLNDIISSKSDKGKRNTGVVLQIGEAELFDKWLALPHPELNIKALLISYARSLPRLTRSEEAEVAATVTDDQKARFALYAQKLDVHHASIRAHLSDGRHKVPGLTCD